MKTFSKSRVVYEEDLRILDKRFKTLGKTLMDEYTFFGSRVPDIDSDKDFTTSNAVLYISGIPSFIFTNEMASMGLISVLQVAIIDSCWDIGIVIDNTAFVQMDNNQNTIAFAKMNEISIRDFPQGDVSKFKKRQVKIVLSEDIQFNIQVSLYTGSYDMSNISDDFMAKATSLVKNGDTKIISKAIAELRCKTRTVKNEVRFCDRHNAYVFSAEQVALTLQALSHITVDE